MTTMNGAVDLDDLLGSFAMPDQVQAQSTESSSISVQRIASAIQALALVAHDLDHLPKLELLHTQDPLIAGIPADERGPLWAAINAILKSGADTDKFMSAIPAPATGPVFTPYSFDDLLTMPPKEWLIEQVVGVGDIGVLYGRPGCGKTFVGIDMIMAACTGSRWAMRFDTVRPLTVAYCAGEGISGLPARFKAAAYHHGVTGLPNFTFFRTVPQLFSSEEESTVATIRQFVAEWKARQEQGQTKPLDIIFIDTLHTATVAADENSSQDMGKVLHACRWASNELGCAVILVHHTTKDGGSERGSSSLRGAADFMIEVRRLSDVGTKAAMHCSKLKDGEAWKSQCLDLVSIDDFDSVRVWWDEPSDGTTPKGQKNDDKATIKAEMERYAGTRFTSKRLAEVIAKSDNYARNLLTELEKSKECKRDLSDPAKGPSPRNPWVYFVDAPQSKSDTP